MPTRPARPTPASGFALFNLGFRPFFLGAGLFAIISVVLWLGFFLGRFAPATGSLSIFQWHAHEMIYGYAMAVIAGFLLTAVKNWTGLATLQGIRLALLFSLWVLARLLFNLGERFYLMSAGLDLLFTSALLLAVLRPIIQVKQWRQMAIVSKLLLLLIFNLCFYLGLYGYFDAGLLWGIYGGLYTLIGLILTVGRRILPFFIEHGVSEPVRLFNSKWLDVASLVGVVGFFIAEIVFQHQAASAYLALVIFVVNVVRLAGWHTSGIWRNSLLWSLYLSFAFICLGFLMFAGVHWWGTPKSLAIHALAYGGLGVVTLSMMCRVSLGHTGRALKPPPAYSLALGLMIAGTVCRVVLPLFNSFSYSSLIIASQLLWISAFGLFTLRSVPILSKPRPDGNPG